MNPKDDPIELFGRWFADAKKTDMKDPTAMALATTGAGGLPNIRMVLLKGFDARGFVFYTNLGSVKGRELEENPRAALCIHWPPLGRQVRVRGAATLVSDEEADAYFASRERQSRLGAWASKQSQPLTKRLELERRVAKYVAKYPVGTVPRPAFWSGYRVAPEEIEFWQDKPFRLHDRLQFLRAGDGWRAQWLFP
jgi:pyridoxamine 5'-phosphate oxidase